MLLCPVWIVSNHEAVFAVIRLAGPASGKRSIAADSRDEAHGDRRQGFPRRRLVVGGRAVTQARPPEPGHIHRDGPIAVAGMRLPAPLARYYGPSMPAAYHEASKP